MLHLALHVCRTLYMQINLISVFTLRTTEHEEYCIFIYLLQHVSADYYGHHQVVSQLHKKKYIELEAFLLQKNG